MGWLIYKDAGGRQRIVEIPAARPLVGGRVRSADVVLPGHAISRRHVAFQRKDGDDWVQDLSSLNGTTVNDQPLLRARRLEEGDVIGIAEHRVYYTAVDPVRAQTEDDTDRAAIGSVVAPAAARDEQPAASKSECENEVEAASSSELAAVHGDLAAERRDLAAERRAPTPVPGAAGSTTEPRLFRDTRRWRQVMIVARGGMGEVYRAFDRELGEPVAVKRLRYREGEQAQLLQRLHAREAAIGRTIQHPNVVRVLEDGFHDGEPYLLMEWVDGRSLERTLRDDAPGTSTLGLGDAVEVLRQIALGLAAAHATGVVHADLKPANILFTGDGATADGAASNLAILEDPETPSAGGAGEADGIEDSDDLANEITRRAGLPAIPDFGNVPFVAREGELAYLEELAAQVRRDGGVRWVLLLGAAGVGKRRLVDEFRKRAPETPLSVSDELTGPEPGRRGLWITLLPAAFPDDPRFLRDCAAAQRAGILRELYLPPFLRGQAIRMVEKLVHHGPSARAFVTLIERETGGFPVRIIEVLERSFAEGAWAQRGATYRFQTELFAGDDRVLARTHAETLEREEKGFIDFMHAIAPLGSCMDFETLHAATQIERAALFYLIGHGVKSGYLMRETDGSTSFRSQGLRLKLEKELDPRQRRRVVERALSHRTDRLQEGRAPAQLYFEVARSETEEGRADRAARWYVEGALAARESYDRPLFLACVDGARDAMRRMDGGRLPRPFVQFLEERLGGAGRGQEGIDRLRRLPVRVRVKITDFGIARRAGEGGAAAGSDEDAVPAWGTPRYMSPEQARSEALTPGSDIYSLGILARELFEGQHPLGTLRGAGAIQAVRDGVPSSFSNKGLHLPEELRGLLRDMLNPQAGARPTASAVAQRLTSVQIRLALREY